LGDKSDVNGNRIIGDRQATKNLQSESKPESPIWKHIDRWKRQGLKPTFEISAGMLTLWGVSDEL